MIYVTLRNFKKWAPAHIGGIIKMVKKTKMLEFMSLMFFKDKIKKLVEFEFRTLPFFIRSEIRQK